MRDRIIKPENIPLEFFCGVIAIIVLGVVGLGIWSIIVIIIRYPFHAFMGAVGLPLACTIIWFTGHVVENYNNYAMCFCGKQYREILNGYFHKRRCLAHLVKNY